MGIYDGVIGNRDKEIGFNHLVESHGHSASNSAPMGIINYRGYVFCRS